ncbi:MAG: amidohydrolase family protein [Halarsenatibacteraceae bacterium]
MKNKILFKNFTIFTGIKTLKPFEGDIMVKGDKIIKVGIVKSFSSSTKVIEGNKRYIFPGFIDMHSHGDLMNFAPEGLSSKIKQGITTEVTGQCGVGSAPIREKLKIGWKNHMIIRNPLSHIPWNSVEEYFDHLQKRGLDNNLVYFLPHGLLRYNIKQGSKKPMNNVELKEFKDLIVKSFKEGAAGVSLGLCYFPSVYSDHRELKALFKLADEYDRLISVHLKSEATNILESLDEIISLAEGTACRVNISHLKIIGESNEDKLDEVLQKIKENNFSFDSYPYRFGSTTFEIIIPPEFVEDTGLDSLKDEETRHNLKKIYRTGEYKNKSWDNLPNLLGWENIYITGLDNEKMQDIIGFSIQEIGEKLGVEPAEAAFDLLIEENGNILMQDYYMKEKVIEKILSEPNGSIGTDSLFSKINQHPRTTSTYPKVLKEYVFEKKILTLSEAVYKFSKRPAEILKLNNRGEIGPGKKADLVVFSKDELINGTGNGIQLVMINGNFKQQEGTYYYSKKTGKILKK